MAALGHVTPHIFGIRSNISSKLLEDQVETPNLVHGFAFGNPMGHTNMFPQKGRGLRHVTPKIFGIQSNISSKLLQYWELGNLSGCTNNFPKSGEAYVT